MLRTPACDGGEEEGRAGEAGRSNMFITRDGYVWWESCTSAGVYEAMIVYLPGPGWDGGMGGGGMVVVADMVG